MDLTAIIKTFRRDGYLRECLKSLKGQFPGISVIVVDDCGDEHNRELVESYGGLFLPMPFDSGLPAGRNLALEHVKTKHVLIGDDDFFYENHDVEKLLILMEIADIAGGRVVERGLVRNYQATFKESPDGGLIWQNLDERLTTPKHEGVEYLPCDLIFNFFVAKTDVLRKVKWDDNIMVAYEHSDFFINAWKRGVKVLFCPKAFVVHKPEHVIVTEEMKMEYKPYRMRRTDREYFLKKWGYAYYQDLHGYKDVLTVNTFQMDAAKAFIPAFHALKKVGAYHWLEAGSCLGVFRDHDFIAHDSDIDFGVFGTEQADALDEELKKAGFRLGHEFGTRENGFERSYVSPEGIKVDFFYFYETGSTWWHSAWKRKLDGTYEQLFFDFPKALFQDLKMVDFYNELVPLPNPPEQYLSLRYGDWRVPRMDWDWAEDPLCRRR